MAKFLVVEDDKKLSAAVCDCLLLEKHTRRCIDIVDESDKARTRELFQEAAKTGLPMQFENVLRTKSDTGVSVG